MGIVPALGLVKTDASSPGWLRNWSSHSWLLTNLLEDSISRIVCIVLFLASLIGFIVVTLALLGWGVPHDLWRRWAIVSAVISLAAIVLFWNALIFLIPHKVGSLGVNIAALVCLLALNWPADSALGFN
ncbi:MAG: hypothetical protein JXA42_18990 [Anaerolineales bacterium]|nr:hypothetical protein [Anaerolineales bacterium]